MLVRTSTEPNVILASDLREGQVGRIATDTGKSGEIVLRVWEGLVSLSNPSNTWYSVDLRYVNVCPFPAGTEITLTTEV